MAADTNGSGDGISDLEAKIIKQMEYYFGDINLMKDKFLKEKIQEDDGWVTIETMLKFNRLRQLSPEQSVICGALKKSDSGLMEVNEEGDKVRRNPSKPLPEDSKERRDELNARSIYAKAFPLDAHLDELMAFFETYGAVENVFMRRDFHKKTFKGSVFVTFCTKEDAEKFVKEEGTKYKELDLEKKLFKTDYFKEKTSNKKKDAKPPKPGKPPVEETKETDEEKAKTQMTKNAVLFFKGLNTETTREEIKNFFSDHAEVGWVDFDKGKAEGYLRLREPNSAGPTLEKAKAANDGKIIIHDTEIETRVVEGDEEVEYWTRMFKDIAEKNSKNRRGGRSGGRGGRGGYSRGGRRNRGGPQGKKRKKD
ncbi:lupus La protein, partial [Aplysia californica]|uniref:Lupus La protein n=1 Tax=Aplysia californica TaxID=6500 RepID=A0ABM1ACM8_APLCA